MADATGLTSGLNLMWVSKINLKVLWKNCRVMCCEVFKDGSIWNLYAVYETPYN